MLIEAAIIEFSGLIYHHIELELFEVVLLCECFHTFDILFEGYSVALLAHFGQSLLIILIFFNVLVGNFQDGVLVENLFPKLLFFCLLCDCFLFL